jgi:type I restriction enzyme S subunit
MDVLLSIKPEFAEKILDGTKRYEFRKTRFSDPSAVETIYLYASSPAQRIVGAFSMGELISDTPADLWRKYGHSSGITDRSRFMTYFENSEEGHAIEVDQVHELDESVNPRNQVESFSPPISFYYLEQDSKLNLAQHLSEQRIQPDDLCQYSSD